MIKIDLITGFLGSGKTTFLKKYVSRLLKKGLRVGIVENDYGAVNVDMMLLSSLSGDNCVIETVAGACDYDCHKRRFTTKLISLGMSGLDRVIVEPSGIFDVDEFFDSLREEPLDRWYEIGSVIAIADASDSEKLSGYANYILASQVACAGAVVLSKTQLCTREQTDSAVSRLNSALKDAGCDKLPEEIIHTSDWSEITEEEWETITDSGYRLSDVVKRRGSGFSTLYFMNLQLNRNEIGAAVAKLFDRSCGEVFRVKGFFLDDGWYELNATAKRTEVSPIENGQEIIIVIGENLNEKRIKEILNDGYRHKG